MGKLFYSEFQKKDGVLAYTPIPELMRNYDRLRNLNNNEEYITITGEKIDELFNFRNYEICSYIGEIIDCPYVKCRGEECDIYHFKKIYMPDYLEESKKNVYEIINILKDTIKEIISDLELKNDIDEILDFFEFFQNIESDNLTEVLDNRLKHLAFYEKQIDLIILIIRGKFCEIIYKKELQLTFQKKLIFSKNEILTIFEIYELSNYIHNLLYTLFYDNDCKYAYKEYLCWTSPFKAFSKKLEHIFDLDNLKIKLNIEPIKYKANQE